MSTNNEPPANRAAAHEVAIQEHVPAPDQDGPHDVPDDQVIEKTLPAPSVPKRDSA